MRILVTGANGQLGSEIRALAAAQTQHTFCFTDIGELDVCDAQAVREFVFRESIDVIVNCAAYTAVDKAEGDTELSRRLNADAPAYLAAAAAERDAALIQISTDYVFDGTACVPYTEAALPHPNSQYGRTKLDGEERALALCHRCMVIRTAWLYSPYGSNFVKTMMRLGRERDSLGVVFDQVGTPTYAADLARAILTIIDKGIERGVYHFSNEGVCSWYDFARSIHRLAGISCALTPLHTADYPTPAARPHYSVLDKTKIKQTYGIVIPHWEESLTHCIALLKNE
ncbi:MAG: dTDP-4-dehydrorhamnose reductase [Prevotellaceae bacterium]|jgi:dTDP-4-dehydrorhamnose reductase|nr:dTDP-4-dehydrorhamnose reductase [Prevotellaceae bacterium]